MFGNKAKYISIFVIALITLFGYEARSQADTLKTARNVLYLEGGGIGSYGSLNYERIIPLRNKWNLGLRMGFSTYRLKDFTNQFNPDLIVPIAVYGLYGQQHKLEVGIGQAITNIVQVNQTNFQPERKLDLHANYSIGYRYQKDEGGLLVRVTYSPIIEFYRIYRHWGGISIGYGF